jgi:hypothetical protein
VVLAALHLGCAAKSMELERLLGFSLYTDDFWYLGVVPDAK